MSGDVLQELAQQIRFFAETFGVLIVGKQIDEFVTKHCHTTRFKADHRHSRLDLRAQRGQDLPQQTLGQIEHAEIVQRPTATQRA